MDALVPGRYILYYRAYMLASPASEIEDSACSVVDGSVVLSRRPWYRSEESLSHGQGKFD